MRNAKMAPVFTDPADVPMLETVSAGGTQNRITTHDLRPGWLR